MSVGKIAAQIARSAHKRTHGVPVTYWRGNQSVTLTATIGRTRRDQQTHDGVITKREVRDYLIDVADLVIDGQQVIPHIDDEIREESAGTIFVYRLSSPGGDEAEFRYSDRHRVTWRIHTQLIGEQQA